MQKMLISTKKTILSKLSVATSVATMSLSASLLAMTSVTADAKEPVKVGFVMFLSGPASGPFGVPARNAAELLIENINKGSMPAPYNSSGLAGADISPIFVDEASKQKGADYKKLTQKDDVDVVIGYISSGSCKEITPVAEEAQKLTLFFDCGTPQIFEEINTTPKYVFRTTAHSTMDNVAAARYLVAHKKLGKKVAGINQNYAWGQDSWRDFTESLKVLSPDTKVVTEQFPKIYAGQYGAEISALLTKKPEVVHSSFWGGDMEALVLQGSARGIFSRSTVVLTTGESAMHRLAQQMPKGTIIGARGPNGDLAPESELNTWFRKAYQEKYGELPTYPAYHMAQALLGLKTAVDKAGSTEQDAMIAALERAEFATPSGTVSMTLANGHQATMETAYGRYEYDKKNKKGSLVDIVRFPAACVNPPEGVNSLDWISSGFKGAQCD